MWSILKHFQVPNKLIRLLKMCYNNTRSRVKIGGELSEAFEMKTGLKQGCALSTLLFNLVLEWVMRSTPTSNTPVHVGDCDVDRLAFADDVDLMDEKLIGVEQTYVAFKRTAKRPGLDINQGKTKVLIATREPDQEGHVNFDGDQLEIVKSFKYLGSTISHDDIIEQEISLRIASATRCAWSLNGTFKSRQLSKVTKTHIYATIIRPILIYGSETWRLTKLQESRISVFERSVLRRIWGPIMDAETGELRRLHNHELVERTRIPCVANVMRAQRLRWAGHVARMDEQRAPPQVMEGNPRGRRPLGRPRKRWRVNLREDLQLMNVTQEDWQQQAQDRSRWRQMVRAAKEHPGPAPPE